MISTVQQRDGALIRSYRIILISIKKTKGSKKFLAIAQEQLKVQGRVMVIKSRVVLQIWKISVSQQRK